MFSKKTLGLIMLALFSAGMAWGTQYRWKPNGSSTNLNWSNSNNWEEDSSGTFIIPNHNAPTSNDSHTIYVNTDQPGASIEIDLDADIDLSSATIYFETDSSRTVKINLNGHSISLGTVGLGNKNGNSDLVQFTISGPGTFSAGSMVYKNTAENSTMDINGGATVIVNGNFTNASNKTLKLNTDSSSTLAVTGSIDIENVPASGANVRSGSGTVIWRGTASTAWNDVANWSGISNKDDLGPAALITIPAGCPNYPEFEPVYLQGTVDVKQGASVTFDHIFINHLKNAGTVSTNNCDIGSSLEIDSTGILTIGGDLNYNATSTITNTGSFSVGGTVTFANDTTITGDITAHGIAGASVSVSGTCTLYGDITTTASNTFGTLDVKDSVSINQSNTYTTFKCTEPGKTITFASGETQTATNFIVTGSAGNEITLQSDSGSATAADDQWNLVTSDGTHTSFVKVQNSNSTNPIYAQNSQSLGNNTNWILAGNYFWTGNSNSSWKNAANWKLELSPLSYVAAANYPGENSTDDTATITGTGISNWPDYSESDAIEIKNITVGSAGDTNASLKISGTGNIQLNGTILNYGKIIVANSGRIADTATTPIMDTANGTVEYIAGADQITNFGTGSSFDYNNLIITGLSAPLESGHEIIVNGTFSIDTSSSITGGQSINVNGTSEIAGNITTEHSQTYFGEVILKNDVVLISTTSSTYGAAFLDKVSSDGTAKSLTIGDTLHESFAQFSGLVTNINALTAYGNATFNGTVQNTSSILCNSTCEIKSGKTITTSGVQTYTGLVTNAGTINVPSLADGTTAIEFKGGINSTGTITGNTTTNPDIVFSGGTQVLITTINQNNDEIKFTNASDIEFTAGNSTYNNISNNSTGSVKLMSDLSVSGNLNNAGKFEAGTSTVLISGNWDNSGTFDAGTSTVTINGTSGSETKITGETNFYNLTCSTSGKILTFEKSKTQNVSNKLTISGTESSPIVLQSSDSGSGWTITASVTGTNAASVTGVFVKDSNSTNDSITATNSLSLGNNTNWNIAQKYTWTGTQDTAWEKFENWKISFNGTDYPSNDYPGKMSTLDNVTIPEAANKPVFSGKNGDGTTAVSLSDLNLSDSGSELTLNSDAGIILLQTSSPVINKGKIIYSDDGRITNSSLVFINDATQGEVEYNSNASSVSDTGTASDYYVLTLKAASLSLSGDINTASVFSLDSSSEISGGAHSLSVSGNALFDGTISGVASISVTGTSSINKNISTTGNQSYNGNVTLKNDITLLAGTNSVVFGSTCNSDGTPRSLSVGNTTQATNFTFKNKIGDSSALNNIEVFGSLESNAGSINANGNLTCHSSATFRGNVNASSVSVTGTTTVGMLTNFVTTTGPQNYTGKVSVNTDSANYTKSFIAGSDTVKFTNGLDAYINAGTLAQPQIIIGDSSNPTNLDIDYDIGTSTTPLSSLTVYGTTALGSNTQNIITTGKQDFKGNVTFQNNITFNSTANDTITLGSNLTSSPQKNVTIQNGKISETTGNFTANDLTINNSSSFTFGTGSFTSGKITLNNSSSFSSGNGSLSSGDLTLNNTSSFAFGIGPFSSGTVTVASGSSFTQTGDNGTNVQELTGIVNHGTMIWDSASQGGTLSIGADGITDDATDATLVAFNKKNLSLSGAPLSGIFYDLIIPDSKTITNGYKIVVRNNFTINGTYTHNGKTLVLGTFSAGPNTYETGPDGIISGADLSTEKNLGEVIINQGTQSKDFKFPVNISYLKCNDTTPSAGEIKFEKSLTVENSATGTNALSSTGTFTFASDSTSSTPLTTTFKKGVEISSAAKVNLAGIFKTTDASVDSLIKINSPVELTSDAVFETQGKSISFGSTITKKDSTENTLQISSNPTGSFSSGTISIAGNIDTGSVSIENPSDLIFTGLKINSTNGFTVHGNGNLALGSALGGVEIKTQNKDILFDTADGTITLVSDLLLDTGSDDGNITVNKNVAASQNQVQKLSFKAGTGNILLNSDFASGTMMLNDAELSGKNITLETGKKFYAKSLAIADSNLLHLKNSTLISAPEGFTKTGNGLSQIASTISTSDSEISFNTDTYIYGETSLSAGNAAITIGSGTTGNLFISALTDSTPQNPCAVSFAANEISVRENVILFNGNVSLTADLSAGKDIVLLNGQTTGTDSIYRDSVSGVADLFDYHNPVRTSNPDLCAPSFSLTGNASLYPEVMPDSTTVISHAQYKSTLYGFASKTISAGQNFYCNGVDLAENSLWNLLLKDNDNARDSFAECYNCKISGCRVMPLISYAWLSAGESCTDGGNNPEAPAEYYDDGTTEKTRAWGVAFNHPVFLPNNPPSSQAEGRKDDPEIPNFSGTYIVRDNVIRVEFIKSDNPTCVIRIENSNNEISKAIQNQFIKYNVTGGDAISFEAAYIDAECTSTTDGKGDLAVIYLKAPDNKRWNLDATGIDIGTQGDTQGNLNSRTNDIQIQKALNGVFATLTDEHKNRIGNFYGEPPVNPNDHEGFRFTATVSRCVFGQMHIALTIADFSSDKIYIYFDSPLGEDITWKTYNPTTPLPTENSIKIYSTLSSEDTSYYVTSIDRNTLNKNGLILTLNKPLDYSRLTYGIKIIYGSSFLYVNKIHSEDFKVIESGESHCISDFIVNCIEPQYAYDDRNLSYMSATGTTDEETIVMRDFTGEGMHNKVFAEKDITLVTKNISGNSSFRYKIVADITPSANSNGVNYTAFSGNKTRAWIPGIAGNTAVKGFAPVMNTSSNIHTSQENYFDYTVDASTDIHKYIFKNMPDNSPCLNWGSGSDVRFMFEVLNGSSPIIINHKYDISHSEETPLYTLRLKNPLDFTSIDLWSFVISEPQRQRGNVSIYNNVVNATNKEFCTLEVNMPREGNLRVIVMTADGNIVKYLENGRPSAGLHYYYWNGTNNSGDAVARGIYFVRVVGPDIEETRKIMVVK